MSCPKGNITVFIYIRSLETGRRNFLAKSNALQYIPKPLLATQPLPQFYRHCVEKRAKSRKTGLQSPNCRPISQDLVLTRRRRTGSGSWRGGGERSLNYLGERLIRLAMTRTKQQPSSNLSQVSISKALNK